MQVFIPSNSKFYYMDFMVNGKRIKKTTKTTDKKKAQQIAATEFAKFQQEAHDEQNGVKTITLEAAYNNVIATVGGRTKESYTLCKNKIIGAGRFDSIFHFDKDTLLHTLTEDNIDEFIRERANEGMKPNSINVELRVLRVVLNKHSGRAYKQPSLDKVKTLKGFMKTRYLTEQEETAILANLAKEKTNGFTNAFDFCLFLLDTGLRLNEALNVQWPMFDLKNGILEVYRTKTNSNDVIPLSPRVVEMLERRKNYAQPFGNMDRAIKVLRREIGKVCNTNPVIVQQKGAATIHSLRDTFATRLIKDGMTILEISNLLGHSHIAMSLKYAHVSNADVVAKARMLMSQRQAQAV